MCVASVTDREEIFLRIFHLRTGPASAIMGLICLSIFFFFSTVEAAMAVAPMRIAQGVWVQATLPQLQNGLPPQSLIELNELFRNRVLTVYRHFEQAALETRADPRLPEHMKEALTFHADYEVFRNDSRFVSLGQTIYQYTGGAHGMSFISAATIQLPSGRLCRLSDLFVVGANYQERLDGIVRREGASRGLPLWDFHGVKADSGFYLTDEGLVLYFQPYEIAPYSEGIVKILVRYQEVADLLSSATDH